MPFGIVEPLERATGSEISKIQALFFDIDDTFSSTLKTGDRVESKILPEAYNALWRLARAGIQVVPVTGRPAGWCDHITRMWPVTAVVCENGAFYSYLDSSSPPKLVKRYLESPAVRKKNALKLKALHKALLKKFPGAKVPSDQPYREFDLAIDYCEDVKRWPDSKVTGLLELARKKGAMAKLSSIHVNIWYGKYDKWTCTEKLLRELLKIDVSKNPEAVAYIGDSPNDEPFFERLPLTFGVANVRHFLSKMRYHPRFVTPSEGGLGFAELADRILRERQAW